MGPAAQQPSPSCSSAKLWLRLAVRRVYQESAVAVAGVAGLEAGRFALSRGRAELFLAVAPVLRRDSGTRRATLAAVVQPGDDADRLGVGRTLGVDPPRTQCVADDGPSLSRSSSINIPSLVENS